MCNVVGAHRSVLPGRGADAATQYAGHIGRLFGHRQGTLTNSDLAIHLYAKMSGIIANNFSPNHSVVKLSIINCGS